MALSSLEMRGDFERFCQIRRGSGEKAPMSEQNSGHAGKHDRYPFDPSNHILHARSRRHYWAGAGPLSVKSFAGGKAYYRVSRGHYAVDERSYLLLNHGQHYEIEVDSETPVESFCLFFRQGFAEEVYRSLIAGSERLLDDPETPAGDRSTLSNERIRTIKRCRPRCFSCADNMPSAGTIACGSKNSFMPSCKRCSRFIGTC